MISAVHGGQKGTGALVIRNEDCLEILKRHLQWRDLYKSINAVVVLCCFCCVCFAPCIRQKGKYIPKSQNVSVFSTS